jgi:dipeptidyl aminopeptidase/acylaminoacyl peptidase
MDSTPFADLDHYLSLRRVSGLALSPDGDRLVVSVAALNGKRTAYVSSLWEVDPAGQRPSARLTWGSKSESDPMFLPDGSLIFHATRAEPDADEAGSADADDPAGLWLLPPTPGEARPLATRPGGIGVVAVAQESGTLVLGSLTFAGADTAEQDADRRKARKEHKVSAVLHDTYPARYWDSDLGPDRVRLFVGEPAGSTAPGSTAQEPLRLRDLTGHIGSAIGGESSWSVSPDGATVVVSWQELEPGGSLRNILASIDVATGERRVLLADPDFEYFAPVVSPDGSRVAVRVMRRASSVRSIDERLCVLDLRTGKLADAAPAWDRWPADVPVWTPDSAALLVVADDDGRAPVWRIDLGSGTAVRLTADDGAYSDLQLTRDGDRLYALRASIGAPPAPVRLDPGLAGQQPVFLPGPVEPPPVPGTVTNLSTHADDGSIVRGWLVLPEGADPQHPAPLLVWLHGGPLGSWNSWSWRWNPWLAAARGYAVLLPDPALSTGYGLAAIERGWGNWGTESYTDAMSLTDAAIAREEIDATRTAAMGGSYGGYLANWIAGHTDRFRGIVSHAGLWALDQFGPTTDAAYFWRRMMTPQMAEANSPHRFVDQIRTPMLVIHGDRDYRVPVGEALRLWAELTERSSDDEGAPRHRFLLFPDEGHWVVKPQNARLWYETVFAFLAQTVHGEPWQTPGLLS